MGKALCGWVRKWSRAGGGQRGDCSGEAEETDPGVLSVVHTAGLAFGQEH